MEEVRIAFKMLTGTPTEKRPLIRPRRTWEDNITIDLKEMGINTRECVDSVQDMNYWRTSGFHKPWIEFVFVLMGWSLLPNALRPTKIYYAPPNLGITRTSICRLNFAQRPIFSGLRFFNEREISDSGPPA
jgi:hypothetical protein